jgi:hypothetical protein
MRIIEKVELPETEIRCWNCHSLLAYNKSDIVCLERIHCGELYTNKVVKCPACKKFINIEDEIFKEVFI